MSSRLIYRFVEVPFREETVRAVKDSFNEDIGSSSYYFATARFKTEGGWTRPFRLLYDTGAIITLLPMRMFQVLKVENYVRDSLRGVSPEFEIEVRLCKAIIQLEDEHGNMSPEIAIWAAIAERDDVSFVLEMKDLSIRHKFETDPEKKNSTYASNNKHFCRRTET